MNRTFIFCCSLICIVIHSTVLAMNSSQADALVSHVISNSPRKKGMCAVPRLNDGAFAMTLAKKNAFIVHTMSDNDQTWQSVQQQAENAGIFGRSLYIEKGTPVSLPFADNFLDLLVLFDLTDATLPSISASEIKRAVSPGGYVIIGRASAISGGSISTSALSGWMSTGGINGTTITDAQGTWAAFTIPEHSGMDEWTHRRHGPDNNPVSSDAITWPLFPQYSAKPQFSDGTYTISSGGVLYTFGHRTIDALRIYNGRKLWQRTDLNPSSKANMQVASGNYIYIAQDSLVLRLKAETGEEITPITISEAGGEIKWIAKVGAILYILAGNPDQSGGNVAERAQRRLDGIDGHGKTIVAYDVNSNTEKWRQNISGVIDHRDIGLSDGNIFYFIRNKGLVCRDATTGNFKWDNTRQGVIDSLEGIYNNWVAMNFHYNALLILSDISGFLCSPDVVVTGNPEDKYIIGFSTTNGNVLWAYERKGGRGAHKLLFNNVLHNTQIDRDYKSINPLTGQPDANLNGKIRGRGCGPLTGCPTGILTQWGGFEYGFSQGNLGGQQIKAPCGQGHIISNGLVITPPTRCLCTMLRGYTAQTSRDNYDYDKDINGSDRLVVGPNGTGNVAALNATTNDWWTHRANIQRTGASGATIPNHPNHVWSYKPSQLFSLPENTGNETESTDFTLTPPVTAGNYVYWGASDGTVKGYNIEEKSLVWTYRTGGCIFATPTVWDGRVYVGSADGWAYCLEAKTGRLLWKFNAAPSNRKYMYYGHLINTWPVITGVLVHNGTAYFGAGIMESAGAHYYAVDAATGAMKWQNHSSSSIFDATMKIGYTPYGYMTIHNGTLWARTYLGPNANFDLATGTSKPVQEEIQTFIDKRGASRIFGMGHYGRDIGLIDNKYLVFGGRPLFYDRCYRDGTRAKYTIFSELDNQGKRLFPQVELFAKPLITPTWDNQVFVGSADRHEKLVCWDIAKLKTYLTKLREDNPISDYTFVKGNGFIHSSDNDSFLSLRAWAPKNLDMNAVVLSSNAVIATHGSKSGRSYTTWKLTAFDKQNGQQLWEKDLPGEPAHQGLAVMRNGDVVVTLANGEVHGYGSGDPVSVVSVSRTTKLSEKTAQSLKIAAQNAVSTGRNSDDSSKNDDTVMSALPKQRKGNSERIREKKTGTIVREIFEEIPGYTPLDLTANANFPHTVSSTEYLQSLSVSNNRGDNYGSRIRGYIHPPANGIYTFWITSDESAELYLSDNDDPSKKQLIARNPSAVVEDQWDMFKEQKSPGIPLEQEKKYYFEIIHKEAYGHDHLVVAWSGPGIDREIIQESFLSPFTLGSGGITREYWSGLWGETVEDLIGSSYFPKHPTGQEVITEMAAPQSWADNYGQVMHGYIHPPVTGEYRFWIAADESAEFWLSENADPNDVKVIARVTKSVGYQQWDVSPEQKSTKVKLIGGRKYYLRVIHKESSSDDHCSISWEIPGKEREVIKGTYLSPIQ